jgi:hypothetical protein
VTTAVMRRPSRPPVVGQAAAVLWTVAAAFALACSAKVASLGTFHEVGRDAQLRTARLENSDPDLLEGVPFLLEVAAFGVILLYIGSAIAFALAASSVGTGGRKSLHRTVFATASAALACLLQPALWLRMHTKGQASTVQILDRIAEQLPWWVTAGDILAALALITALTTIAMLRSDDAQWYRGARS